MKKSKTALIKILAMVICVLLSSGLYAQAVKVNPLTLKEAQDYAVKNHYLVKNSQIDVEIAKKKIWETAAAGLPQVNASIQYQDFLDIPTTLLPDFITPYVYYVNENKFGLTPTVPQGEPGNTPVKFGTQQNASIGGTLSQLLFNGPYIIGLQAISIYHLYYQQNLDKTLIDVRSSVAVSYMALAIQKENRRLLVEGKELISKTLFETKEQFKNGFVEDIVVDQLQLNLTNLENTINAIDRQIEVSDKLLKFQIGIDIKDSIVLKDSIGSLLQTIKLDPVVSTNFHIEDHIDYKLLSTNEKLNYMNYKREKSAYLPTLAGYYTYTENAMRNDFSFFDSSQKWYPTSILGIKMDIPIFSSGMKRSRVSQAKLALEKAQYIKNAGEQALQIDAELARTTFNTDLENFKKESDNMKLANNIYQKTNQKFKEGLAGSTDITTAYNQYLTVQSSYYQSIFTLLNAKIKLDKALSQY